MKKTLFLALALLLGAAGFAQGPGYMGKHFIINADCRLSPSWIHPNPLSNALAERFPDDPYAQRYLGLNYIVNPSVEMIVSENSTVGIGYNFYKSPFNGRVWRDYEIQDEDGYSMQYYSWAPEFAGTVTAHGFNAFYKIYPFDSYAPFGYYLKFAMDGFFYHFDLDQQLPGDLLTYYPEMEKDHGALFGARVEMGRDYLFFNCLRLSLGVSLGATFGGFKATAVFDPYPDNYDKLVPDSYARNRILSAYWFGLKVGLGVLAF